MTNKLFIVKYIFVVVDVDIDKNNAFSRNLSINLDRRESFDDANFDIIVAQNIYVFDIANDILNKIDSIKLDIKFFDIINEIEIVDEIKKI